MSRNIWISSVLEVENAQKTTFSIFLYFSKYWNHRVRKLLKIGNKLLFLGKKIWKTENFPSFFCCIFFCLGLFQWAGLMWSRDVTHARAPIGSGQQLSCWRLMSDFTSLLVPIITYRNTFLSFMCVKMKCWFTEHEIWGQVIHVLRATRSSK